MSETEDIINLPTNSYREICEQIPQATLEAVDKLKKEIEENEIRDLRGDPSKTKKRKTIRLTTEQHQLAADSFKSFFEVMIAYLKFYSVVAGKGAKVSPLYNIFVYGKLALESYTRSMFTCFDCGEIIPIKDLVVKNRIAYHPCEEGILGRGNRTSWLYIYATFVKNQKLKEALFELNNKLNLLLIQSKERSLKK